MSTNNTDMTRLEQFANDHDADFDELDLSLDVVERLERDLSKTTPLKNRGLSDRAEEIERDVLDTLEAAASADPDPADGPDAPPDRPAGREIQLPEGVSAAEAEIVIERLGEVENPVLIEADTLAAAGGDGETPPDTLSQIPETQTGGGGGGDDPAEKGFDPSELSLSDRDRLTTLRRKASTFRARDMERADVLEAEMADLAGVESAADIEWDRL